MRKGKTMILIGQYDSSFTRRVAVTLSLYGMAFEHRPWSVFGDAEKIRPFNPLGRVPTLVLDDGEALIDSAAIIDHLDSLMEPQRRLCPPDGPDRRKVLKTCAMATGMTDLAVALFYMIHTQVGVSDAFMARRMGQIGGALDWLEASRAAARTAFWFGETIGHADIAAACALRHVTESMPGKVSLATRPALAALSVQCEALEVFKAHSQRFIPPV